MGGKLKYVLQRFSGNAVFGVLKFHNSNVYSWRSDRRKVRSSQLGEYWKASIQNIFSAMQSRASGKAGVVDSAAKREANYCLYRHAKRRGISRYAAHFLFSCRRTVYFLVLLPLRWKIYISRVGNCIHKCRRLMEQNTRYFCFGKFSESLRGFLYQTTGILRFRSLQNTFLQIILR